MSTEATIYSEIMESVKNETN